MKSLRLQAEELRGEARQLEAQAKKLREAARLLTGEKKSTNKRRPRLYAGKVLKERGLTYRTVANALGYSKRTVQNVCLGETTSRPLLEKLSALVNVPADELARPL